jgi:hypothetical protein
MIIFIRQSKIARFHRPLSVTTLNNLPHYLPKSEVMKKIILIYNGLIHL